MNRFTFMLSVALTLTLPSLGSAAYFDPNTGRTWRDLTETTGFSWNQINALERDNTTGVFADSAMLDTTLFGGWTWATLEDVDQLFGTLTNGVNPGGVITNQGEPNSTWAGSAIGTLGGLTGTNPLGNFAMGVASTVSSNQDFFFNPFIFDNADPLADDSAFEAVLRPTDFLNNDAGVWLYQPSPVPIPAAAWLFGTVLAGAGLISWRKKKA